MVMITVNMFFLLLVPWVDLNHPHGLNVHGCKCYASLAIYIRQILRYNQRAALQLLGGLLL